jgi:hypothetical protein
MTYDVHVFRTVRIKVEGIEADSPIEAIKKAQDMEEFSRTRHRIDEIEHAEVMDDEGTTYYLVDPIKDNGEVDEQSPDYSFRGPAPFYPETNTGAQSLLEDLFKKRKNRVLLRGLHPYLDQLLIEYKIRGAHPLTKAEFRKLPTLLHKDDWLDEKIKHRFNKGE